MRVNRSMVAVVGIAAVTGVLSPVARAQSAPPTGTALPATTGSASASAPASPPAASTEAATGGAVPPAGSTVAKPRTVDELAAGTIQYGLAFTLLRFRVTRSADEPGRNRNYVPELAAIPGPEVGFHVAFLPPYRPWRVKKTDGTWFQLMSVGVTVLAGAASKAQQGNLGIALTLGFLEERLTLGMGFDLYRGIPVAGGGTATTGVFGWALSPRGEVTPENVFFVVGLGLDSLFSQASGKEQQPAAGVTK